MNGKPISHDLAQNIISRYLWFYEGILGAQWSVRIKKMWCFARFGTFWYNLKGMKNNHGAVLLLVKIQTEAFNFT